MATEEDDECRVCRGGNSQEEGGRLFTPCNCTGSIQFVHQQCLEQWLDHSNKEACELCGVKYQFEPSYKPGTPEKIPNTMFSFYLTKRFFQTLLPRLVQWVLAAVLWLGVLPIVTSYIYRGWMRQNGWTTRNFISAKRMLSWDMVKGDISCGVALTLAVGTSFMVLMSFVDFLRIFWAPEADNNGNLRRARAAEAQNNNQNQNNNNNNNNDDNNAAAEPVAAAPQQLQQPPAEEQEPAHEQPAAHQQPLAHREEQPDDDDHDADDVDDDDLELEVDVPNIENENLMYGNDGNAVDDDDASDVESVDSEVLRMEFQARDLWMANQAGEIDPADAALEGHFDNIDQARARAMLGHMDLGVDVEEEDDNVDDFIDDDPFAQDWGDDDQAGRDILVVFLELVGLRGHWTVLIRNIFWVVCFNFVYTGFFTALPSSVGYGILHSTYSTRVLWKDNLAALSGEQNWQHISDTITFVSDIHNKWGVMSTDIDNPIFIWDVLDTFVGYTFMIVLLLLLDGLTQWLRERTASENAYVVKMAELLSAVGTLTKVGFILFVRVFVLPLCLGIMIIFTYNVLAQYTPNEWSFFICENVIGSLTLTWALGIFYLLTTTLSVLQLREVLHPDFLSKFIRPQEAHKDLLSSLISESIITHVRRVCISLFVYVVLLVFIFVLPVFMVSHVMPTHDMYRLRSWYGLSIIQLPLEIGISHICILTMLEKKKNFFGNALYAWFSRAAYWTGLTGYLMPRVRNTCTRNGEQEVAVLRRPPAGWDTRNYSRSQRWAWTDETPGAVETSLVPREYPSMCYLRVTLLVLMSWCCVVVCEILFLALPFLTGRQALSLLGVPANLHHDPVALMLGVALVLGPVLFCYTSSITPYKAALTFAELFKLPSRLLARALLIGIIMVAMTIGVGLWYCALVTGDISWMIISSDSNGTAISFNTSNIAVWGKISLIGTMICYFVTMAQHLGLLDNVCKMLGLQNCMLPLYMNMRTACQALWYRVRGGQPRRTEKVLGSILPEIQETFASLVVPLLVAVCATFLWFQVGSLKDLSESTWQQLNSSSDLISKYLAFDSSVVMVTRTCGWCIVARAPYVVCEKLLSQWLSHMHNDIRDENYLIGRKLSNRPRLDGVQTLEGLGATTGE